MNSIKIQPHPNYLKVWHTRFFLLISGLIAISFFVIESNLVNALVILFLLVLPNLVGIILMKRFLGKEFKLNLNVKYLFKQSFLEKKYGIGTLVFLNNKISGIHIDDYLILKRKSL
jgi:hypothetical protein